MISFIFILAAACSTDEGTAISRHVLGASSSFVAQSPSADAARKLADMRAIAEKKAEAADRKTLADAGIKIDDESLLNFFRKRTLTPERVKEFKALVKKLGAVDFRIRDQASKDLMLFGAEAIGLAREEQAAANDVEIMRRLEQLLTEFGGRKQGDAHGAAARHLSRLGTPGSLGVLFGYLPFAADERTKNEIQVAINALAAREDGAVAKLLELLRDEMTTRRAAACQALVHAKGLEHKNQVLETAKNLPFVDRPVIYRSLAENGEEKAIDLAIDLLSDLPASQAWRIRSILYRLSTGTGKLPTVSVAMSAEQQEAAWREWWKTNRGKVRLASLKDSQELEGFTLVAQYGVNGRVYELDPAGQVTWSIPNLRSPIDARYLSRDRIVVCQYSGSKVSVLEPSGKIIWEANVSLPTGIQILPDGNIFVCSRPKHVILDKDDGSVVSMMDQPGGIAGGIVRAAARFPKGQTLMIDSTGNARVFNAKGTVTKQFKTGRFLSVGSRIEVISDDRFLAALYSDGKVVEMDLEGKVHWEARVLAPRSAHRLPNGNTIVASTTQARIVEFDPAGQEISTTPVESNPYSVDKR